MLSQAICTLSARYSFARLRFRGQNVIFLCALVTIIVPSQVIALPHRLCFRDFEMFGLIPLFNQGKGINMLNKPAVIYLLSALGMPEAESNDAQNKLIDLIWRMAFDEEGSYDMGELENPEELDSFDEMVMKCYEADRAEEEAFLAKVNARERDGESE